MPPTLRGNAVGAGALTNLAQPDAAAKSHRARGTDGAPLPAISCLGAFQTPAARACGGLVTAGVRKAAQQPTSQAQTPRHVNRRETAYDGYGWVACTRPVAIALAEVRGIAECREGRLPPSDRRCR